MQVTQTHNESLLAFLALAEIEEEARRPLQENSTFSGLLTLLIGIQPDVETIAERAGSAAMLATALADGMRPIDPRAITRQFPRESPSLFLASQRLKTAYTDHAVYGALSRFLSAVAHGKDLTIGFILSDYTGSVRCIAEAWQSAAGRAADLIRAMAQELGSRQLGGLEEEALPLLSFLDEAANGGYSAIDANGALILPRLREGREAKRVPVRCAAVVIHHGHAIPAVLRDMSVTGLGLEVSGLTGGEAIEVKAGRMVFSGRVEWAKDGRAGVRLDERIVMRDPRLAFLTRRSGQPSR